MNTADTNTQTMNAALQTFRETFTDPTPCTGCGRAVLTYCDPETGRCYCLPCLEDAVAASQAEVFAERQEMALLACHSRQIAA